MSTWPDGTPFNPGCGGCIRIETRFESMKKWFRRMWFEAWCNCHHLGAEESYHTKGCRSIQMWGR